MWVCRADTEPMEATAGLQASALWFSKLVARLFDELAPLPIDYLVHPSYGPARRR